MPRPSLFRKTMSPLFLFLKPSNARISSELSLSRTQTAPFTPILRRNSTGAFNTSPSPSGLTEIPAVRLSISWIWSSKSSVPVFNKASKASNFVDRAAATFWTTSSALRNASAVAVRARMLSTFAAAAAALSRAETASSRIVLICSPIDVIADCERWTSDEAASACSFATSIVFW